MQMFLVPSDANAACVATSGMSPALIARRQFRDAAMPAHQLGGSVHDVSTFVQVLKASLVSLFFSTASPSFPAILVL